MNTYTKNNSKWVTGFIAVCFVFLTFTLFSDVIISIKCGSDETETKTVNLRAHNINANDTAAATNAYAIWAGAKAGVICNGNDCAPDDCIPYATDFGGTGYPTPNYNSDTGIFRFPAYKGKVTVRCDCYTDVTKVEVEIIDGGPFPFDPVKDNEEDTEIQLRNKKLGESINIYPNPAHNRINLDFKDFDLEGDFKVSIYDAMGKVVETMDIIISDYSYDVFDIQTSYYQSGIYYLSISGEDGVVSKSKFIITER